MDKATYIAYRKENNAIILWEYYIEQCKEQGIEQKVRSPQELLQFISMWGNLPDIFTYVIQKLDNKFTITKILNQKQEIIGIQ